MSGVLCKKCGTYYEEYEVDYNFYFDYSRGVLRRPCKKCISAYNKSPEQKEIRYKANARYLKTRKGREAARRAKDKRLRRLKEERRYAKEERKRNKTSNG